MVKIVHPNTKAEVSERSRREFMAFVAEQIRIKNGLTGYDPVLEMALMATDPQLQKMFDLRLSANKEVAKYFHPQLKQVEMSGPEGGPIRVASESVLELTNALEEFIRVEKKEAV